jgi:hypothetical protein
MQSENSLPQRDSSPPRWQQLLAELGLLGQIATTMPVGPDLSAVKPSATTVAIQQGLARLTETGQVIELRILGIGGKKRTDSGYFSNPENLAKAAARYDGRAEGIYFTVNPVNPALMARANNRVKPYAEHTTSDQDILKRINFPIDFDPVRPADISSTDEEQHAALVRAWACRLWLNAQGWPEPVFASSGNGAHLIYPIDLPNDGDRADLIKACLSALSSLFSDNSAKVDTSTGNASRIFKLYGTLACKGDNIPERPHRRAAILAAPERRQVVTSEQLMALAAQAPQPKVQTLQSASASSRSRKTAYGRAALDKEIASLSATADGNRNNQLFQSAAALFELVASNTLERSEVWNALFSTALSIGLSAIEARRTIASGEKHGTNQPRVIPQHSSEDGSETSHTSRRDNKTSAVHDSLIAEAQPIPKQIAVPLPNRWCTWTN